MLGRGERRDFAIRRQTGAVSLAKGLHERFKPENVMLVPHPAVTAMKNKTLRDVGRMMQ